MKTAVTEISSLVQSSTGWEVRSVSGSGVWTVLLAGPCSAAELDTERFKDGLEDVLVSVLDDA
jgi:hypothetical protein